MLMLAGRPDNHRAGFVSLPGMLLGHCDQVTGQLEFETQTHELALDRGFGGGVLDSEDECNRAAPVLMTFAKHGRVKSP